MERGEKVSDQDWPRVWLLFATYKRTSAALATIESLKDYLLYPNLHWHICDDGSGKTDDGTDRWHVGVLAESIGDFYAPVTWHEMDTPPGKFNTGGNVNRGIRLAQENGCDIHILIFDDWALMRELDIRPMVNVLERYEEVGFIRLSYTVPWLGGYCVRYDPERMNQIWMWFRLIRDWTLRNPFGGTEGYMVSTQPYVAHRRFFEAYGYHPENCTPGDAETGMGRQYNESPLGENGPQILFPIGPCTVHAPWGHIAARANDYAAQFGQA
jgi:hypothetical protein